MPAPIALSLCALVVIGALALDSTRRPAVSGTIWIPVLWMLVLASRPIVSWLHPGAAGLSDNVEDGSGPDRAFLSVLILAVAGILWSRRLAWGRWLQANRMIVLFLLYCGLSTLWSDSPAVAFKRWIRAVGSVAMIVAVVSDPQPVAAIAALIRRTAIVLIPFSVVLIKYYRDVGVAYSPWTGGAFLVGVTTDKNALGRLCLIAGVFGFWELLTGSRNGNIPADRASGLVRAGLFLATVALLAASNSATSLASFVIGCALLAMSGLPAVRNRANHLGVLAVVGVSIVLVVGLVFNAADAAVASLGRDMTLTDRTFIWRDLWNLPINRVVGLGYDSLWLGDRLSWFVRVHQVNEAHNGYLEAFLELGAVGAALFVAMVASVFFKVKHSLIRNPSYGRLRLAILVIFLVYNVTEAGYKATTSIFFVFLLAAFDVPGGGQAIASRVAESGRPGRQDRPARVVRRWRQPGAAPPTPARRPRWRSPA